MEMRKKVMKKAWEIAKKAEARYGHKAIEYIGESMKWAWVFIKEEQVLSEQDRVKKEMREYQDDIKGRWDDIKEAGLKKAVELGLDEKQEFRAIARLKEQYYSFVNWVPEYDDLENVKQIHQNMINFINNA